jgi:hypothetical protein
MATGGAVTGNVPRVFVITRTSVLRPSRLGLKHSQIHEFPEFPNTFLSMVEINQSLHSMAEIFPRSTPRLKGFRHSVLWRLTPFYLLAYPSKSQNPGILTHGSSPSTLSTYPIHHPQASKILKPLTPEGSTLTRGGTLNVEVGVGRFGPLAD